MNKVIRTAVFITVVIAMLAVMVYAAADAITAPRNDTPDILLVSSNSYQVSFNVSNEASRKDVRAWINNEYKQLEKTNKVEYHYRSEFPIRKLRLEAENRTGKTIKKYEVGR